MAQYHEIAIGDEIVHRTGGMEHYQMIFVGALPVKDGGFTVQVVIQDCRLQRHGCFRYMGCEGWRPYPPGTPLQGLCGT